MSISEQTTRDNGRVMESDADDFELKEFLKLEEEEGLEQNLLNVCLMAENVNKQVGNQKQSETNANGENKKVHNPSGLLNEEEGSLERSSHAFVKENENSLQIKMEISFSPERLIEPNMDYSMDDVVEIHSISDEEDEDSVKDVLLKILHPQKNDDAEEDESTVKKASAINLDDDNEDLLTVFNDHNYMSQENTQQHTLVSDVTQDLRQNIIDHIVKKRTLDANNSVVGVGVGDNEALNDSNSSTIEDSDKKVIEDFVDRILQGKIKEFVKKEVKSEPIRTEDFVQNIFYAVADEDAAEYAAEERLANRKQREIGSKLSNQKTLKIEAINEATRPAEVENVDEQSQDRTETCSFHSFREPDCEPEQSDKESHKSASKNGENDVIIKMETSSCLQSVYSSITESNCDSLSIGNENGSQLDSNATLLEYCSEPLEMTTFEERFEQHDKVLEELEIPLEEGFEHLVGDVEENDPSSLDNILKQFENDLPQDSADRQSKENMLEADKEKDGSEMPRHSLPLVQMEKNSLELQESNESKEEFLAESNTTKKQDTTVLSTDLDKRENSIEKEDELETVKSSSEKQFERLDRVMKEVEICSTSSILKEFNALVKEMSDDCGKFLLAATNIDSRLGAYIANKMEIMRVLMRRCGSNFLGTECASQTEPELSRKRLRKLNKKDKRALLASSDSSSRSTTSNDDHISSSDEMEKNSTLRPSKVLHSLQGSKGQTMTHETEIKKYVPEFGGVARSQLSQDSLVNSESIYDDGVVLTKYLRSDIFSAPSTRTGDDKTSSTSTPTRRQSTSSSSSTATCDEMPNQKTLSTSSNDKKKDKSNKKEKLDENDKEIERLINLDGLMKRHNNVGASKQTDIDKQKSKYQNQKNKTDGVLEFLENDMAKESLSSEDSANDDEEEAITEKQYLERYNQDLKKQLLNDSDSATSLDEEEDNEFEPALSDESESGNRSPLVDKFLKTYNIDDSEEDDTEMVSDEIAIKDTSPTSKCAEAKNADDENVSKKEENQDKNVANTSENSDCELLNDNFIYRKRAQPKSLEKILNEAEKRKKIQKLDEDLISLSSESDCSDVEAVEIEPAEIAKSRAIKPMLRPDQLQRETVKAQKGEVERIRRLEKRQVMLSKILAENKDLKTDEELILDYNEETKTFIKVHSDLVKLLKPHQRDGVRFMYDSCYGGVDSSKKNNGSGCILAHCMGLGKTLQLIVLMHTVISYKELKTQRILVLCPKSTVMNWGDEITRWLFPLRTKNLKVYTFNDTSDINEKLSVMREWSQSTYQKAGCLLIGYEAFRTLVFYHTYKNRNNLDSTRLEKIRNLIDEYLLQPGADLVVCDEGHIIKNSKSAISLAVSEIKTPKRIILTGTPIQNNLKEYYSMVNFIKPLFLGTEKEFANLYANPIKNGQHKDSNKRDIKVMKQRSFVLHKKLSKFVQRKEAELLKSFLPKKFEYVLFIPMTNVQNKLYERILETIKSKQDNRGRGLITDYTCLRKIWTHPKVLEDAWKNAINQKFRRDSRKQSNSDDDQPDDIYDSQTGFMSVKNDWWRNLIDAKDLESILPSNKLRTMFEILRMCEENGDKCLIFSAFVAVLNVVEYFFKKLAEGHKETLSELNMPQGVRSTWEPNKDYFRLDGKTSKSTRHEMIKRFNLPHNPRARVFLISAKAGGQGINLIGANRVIILDTSWNPSNDQQNIFRIFRLGQKKNCYIYRLLALGTMEEKVYSRSVTKQAMSFRVMDVQQIDRHYSMAELAELYTLTIPNYAERPTPIFPQDTILANLLRSFPDLVYKYHEHDSLLENKVEQELSEQEKIDAWNAYENDLQMNSQIANMEDMQNKIAQANMQNYMGSSGSMPGLNIQALLNFRGMNPQTNMPYLNPALLQKYKYNMANQQYLDMVSNYRQYSTPESAAAFNASVAAAYSSINSSIYGAGAPPVSPHLTSGANTAAHPLSALNDLSMYGLGMNSSSSAVAAAAAAATSLAQLPSISSNASSMYATPGIPTPPVGAAGLYSNQTASFYQTLQQLGFAGAVPGSSNILNNPALSSYNNSSQFQTPRQTPPQTATRKSSTPDLAAYRDTGGSGNMATVTPTTSALSLPTTSLPSTAPQSNEQSQTSNLNNIPNNSKSNVNTNISTKNNSDLMNSGNGKTDLNSSRPIKPKPKSNSSVMSTPDINNIARTETTQSRQTIASKSVPDVTSTTKPSTTNSKYLASRTTSKPPNSTNAAASITKTVDPQIRVKDMGQLCANVSRGTSLQAAAAAAARDITSNSFTSNNSVSNNAVNRSKQSAVTNKPTSTASSATELLKARSEMQIIPTTSPPGTASISKQLSEISPSISLTAVRNNGKPTNTNTGNLNKTSAVNTSTTSSSKVSRVNSPVNITPSILTNRPQAPSTNVQSRKNMTSTNAISLSNTNLSTHVKKPTATASEAVPMQSAPTRKVVVSIPTSSAPGTTVSSNSLSAISNNGTITSKNSIGNSTKFNLSASTVRGNMATITPTNTTLGKNIPSILRNHHIRKMPSPLPTSVASISNITTNVTTSTSSSQPNSINSGKLLTSTGGNQPNSISSGKLLTSTSSNQPNSINSGKLLTSTSSNQANSINSGKLTHINNAKPIVSATVANAAQILYNNKITTSVGRSYSPTTTVTQRTSRTASPANTSTVFMEKIVPNSANRVNATTVSTIPTTSSATIAFPVHLKRSNSALGVTRTFSPLSNVKGVATASGIGIRTKSSVSMITPKIASVTSLNTPSVVTTSPTATSSLTPAAAAAIRAATFKKLTSGSGKISMQTAKQLQSTSAMKASAAASVVQQKRPSAIGIASASPQQLPKQRISIPANGRSLNVVALPIRTLPGDTQISGVNIRPILKGVTTTTHSGSTLVSADKRTAVGSQVSSASGQAVKKLLFERKRKSSEITHKDSGSLSKRPKDS